MQGKFSEGTIKSIKWQYRHMAELTDAWRQRLIDRMVWAAPDSAHVRGRKHDTAQKLILDVIHFFG